MAVKRVGTREAIASTLKRGMEKAEHSGINVSEDEFTVIQPSDDLNAVVVTIENSTGSRPVSIKVINTAVILERREDTLGIFR